MSYKFFFSHARFDVGKRLVKFYEDLREKVAGLTGVHNDTSFRDAREIEWGEWWEEKLGNALNQSEALVFLCSPTSIGSNWCGKEWAGFRNRCEALKNVQKLSSVPRLVFPILWIPTPECPKAVTELQFGTEILGSRQILEFYEQNGLEELMARKPRWYQEFLSSLAKSVLTAIRKQPLPDWPEPADFQKIQSAFPTKVFPAVNRFGAHVVYIASDRTTAQRLRFNSDAYGEQPISWKPFYPSLDEPAWRFAWDAAVSENFNPTHVPLKSDFIDTLKDKADFNRVIIVMVDPWSLHHQKDLQTHLKPFREQEPDLEELFNRGRRSDCFVVVPWNREDSEILKDQDTFLNSISTTFPKLTIADRPQDRDELLRRLVQGLIDFRKTRLEGDQEVRRELPKDNLPLPGISAV